MNSAINLFSRLFKKLQLGLVVLAVVLSGFLALSDTTKAEAMGPAVSGTLMTSCALENVGWIACPVIRAAARASDYAFTFISQSFMQIEVSILQGGGDTSRAWGVTRNIANTLFVLFLLYVIYGILSGRGVSNASIKRMLPRFIVAAVLVNFSFILGQIAVDISNILGSSVQSLMASVSGSDNIIAAPDGTLGGPVGADGYIANDGAIARVTSAILSNPNLAWVLFIPLTSVVMSVGVITSIMIIILIIRKVLIVALLLLAPIAFVLYLLPNTEQYFTRWFRMFTQLLILFPIMALLLGSGQIVGSAVMSTTGSGYTVSGDLYRTAGGSNVSATTSLVAIGATVLPLLGTWYVFRGAMRAMDTSVARLQSSGARKNGGDPSKDAERMKRASQSIQQNSLLGRSVDRIKRVTDMQNEKSSNVVGVAGSNVIRRRKKASTPEQQEFDQQVQVRLGEIREGVESGAISATPQQLYVKALQNLESSEVSETQSNIGGRVGLGSFNSVELKAAEAYLIESIGSGSSGSPIDPNSFLKQQAWQQGATKTQSQSDESNIASQGGFLGLSQAGVAQTDPSPTNIPQSGQGGVQLPGGSQGQQSEADQSDIELVASSKSSSSVGTADGGGVSSGGSDRESLGQQVSGGESDSKISVSIDPGMVSIDGQGESGVLGRPSDGLERSAARSVSVTFPAAISERIPSRLQPITDLEKKAQAIAAKHVAASQEKANGADTFEDELRLRAEKASLDPLRNLETRKPSRSEDEVSS